MDILLSFYLFVLGAVLGSFFNVVALRVPLRESIVRPPSRCPACGARLKGRDLIPIASWLASRGTCRHCGTRVSPLYPLGEAATGLLFAWAYATYGWRPETLIGCLLVSLCVIVTVSDIRYMLIPNRVLLVFAPILAIARLWAPHGPIWSHLLGAVVGGGLLLLVALLSKGGMGLGDVKLFALLGGIIGLPQIPVALVAACLAGTIVGLLLLATGRVKRKQPIPFGPFLAFGALLAYGYGTQWIAAYVSILS
ncbi:A24 family peptidase [Cohnella sp. REN36]|uniref:prepilin peptidase n=1 Tax=Cohnella sp. REN36 TaxID=2887347 RepID=UPI001D13D6A9|nr:A24 family peptidase [Cohnella sp. REN36]MCC3374612.1 prepilin peptidase [Cohnella sp. REN36]